MIRWLVLVLVVAGCADDAAGRWKAYQTELLQYGYLRTDRSPQDAPYSNEDLLRAFQYIMFNDEYVLEDGIYRHGLTARPLEKRMSEVRYQLSGAGVSATDRRHLNDIVQRLRGLTKLDIREIRDGSDADDTATVHIFIAGRAERHAFADILAERHADSPLVPELRNDLGGNVCIAVPFTAKDPPGDTIYLIFIPNEVTGRLRRACIEEEFAQAFGPAADDPLARPSIFNDDQEFALFTQHDGWMFRILYDPRLKAGMAQTEAMPIARRILAEIRPDP